MELRFLYRWAAAVALMITSQALGQAAPPPAAQAPAVKPALFPLRDAKTGKMGFVDAKLEYVIKPTWDKAQEFDDDTDLSTVCNGEGDDSRWGSIDRTGKVVIPLQYRWQVQFFEGIAAVTAAGRGSSPYGYIDRDGTALIEPKFVVGRPFHSGLASVLEGSKEAGFKQGYIERSGKYKILLQRGESGGDDFQDGMARVLIGPGTYKFIDAEGKELCRSDKSPAHFANGRCRVSTGLGQDTRYGFIDRAGTLVIPMKYEAAHNFSSALAPAQLDKKWGYFGTSGETAVAFQFDDAREFKFGLAAVKFRGLWGVINDSGKWVAQPIYARIEATDIYRHMLVRRWTKPNQSAPMVIDETYVHNSNPTKAEVPAELMSVLVADEIGLPQAFSGLEKLTDKQRANGTAALALLNEGKHAEAVAALEVLHGQEVAFASVILGRMYQTGMGVKADPKKAYDYYFRPMLDGDGFAQYENAQMARTGSGRARNYEQTEMLARFSAQGGFAPANRLLAALLLEGTMMDVNPELAVTYITKGVQAGDPLAQLAAGYCLERGLGVPKNVKTALAAFESAGEKGYLEGYYRAGRLMELEGDLGKAKLYYEKATAKHAEAAARLAELNKAGTQPAKP